MVAVVEHAWSVSADGAPGPSLLACLEAATAAPSIHNTQPWRFRLHDGVIDVYADDERRLEVVDPRGREMMISLGAAVLNLRVAVLNHGRLPLLRLLPEPNEPDLVARIIPSQSVHPDQTVRALAAAIPRRRTNRRPFADIPVPEEVVDELSAAARVEGGILAVADAIGREAVLGLIRTADGRQRASLPYREELAEWTSPSRERRDGVPPPAYGPWDVMETLPLRDFGVGQPPTNRRLARFEPEPTLIVLYTPGDGPEQWLRAGQALERVLLTATVRGLANTLLTQALEISDLRTLLADPRSGRVAQAIIRLGYGPASAVTPRRPVAEVLVRDPVPGRDGRSSSQSGAAHSGAAQPGIAQPGSVGPEVTRAGAARAETTGAEVTGSQVTGSEVTGSGVTGSDLTGSDLTGSDLTGSEVTGSGLARPGMTG